MRVTDQMFPISLGVTLQKLKGVIDTHQNAVSSGQRVRIASDDPMSFRRALETQGQQIRSQHFRHNIREVKMHTEADLSAAKGLHQIVARASELAVKISNGASDALNDLNVLAAQFNSFVEQAVAISNKQFNGQYLYGGTSLLPSDIDPNTGNAFVPYTVVRNVQGQITGVTYRGNEDVTTVEIDVNSSIDLNTVGTSGTGAPRGLFENAGVSVFTTLINIRDELLAGNVSNLVGTAVNDLKDVEDNVATNLGILSANLERLTFTEKMHTNQLNADEHTISQSSDADLAQHIVALEKAQTTFESALQVGAQILNTSLLNFLR
jgi:flagellar hook-associated protein 3 FlgL